MQCFFDINLFFLKDNSSSYLKSIYKRFMTIVLIGYMGSGKSTIGQYLSKIMGFEYLDLDGYIQDNEGATISEIFKAKGEIYFRNMESIYLKNVLNFEDTVISLGGGTPCYGDNMKAILNNRNVQSIYLKASIPILIERLINEKNDRPLISHLDTKDKLTEFIGKHLFERSFFYNKADKVLSVDNKSVQTIVEEIVLNLF